MAQAPPNAYRDDLAYIHDAGFGAFARNSAPWLLGLLPAVGGGRVIDLGCGSGIWAQALAAAGYDVVGVDLSEAMLSIARQRVPAGKFRQGSFLAAELKGCVAVTAIGEVFNYLFDKRNTQQRLQELFRRVHDALSPGGVFVFDGAEPGRAPAAGQARNYSMGDDWACLFSASEDRPRRTLTRHITSFRKLGDSYRRDDEVHQLRLFDRRLLLAQLRTIGFRARTLRGYGELRFPVGYVGFLARKPDRRSKP